MQFEERSRPTRPSIAELRRTTQPAAISGRSVEHWTASLYLRRLSPYVTRLLLRAGFSANAVTVIMIVTGVLAGAALLVPGPVGVLLAVVLGQLQMLWDCCDGEVARWRRQSGALGIFLDRVGHYAAEVAISLGLGLRVAGLPEGLSLDHRMVVLGAVLATVVALNRALNDAVHAARAAAGLPPLADDIAVSVPRRGGIARLRSAARYLPVHRMLHSVELTLLVLLAAALGWWSGADAERGLLVVLAPLAGLVLVGHLVAIVTSGRLREP